MDHWSQLRELPLVVDALAHDRLEPGEGYGDAHPTRLVRLTGGGSEGLGEDITLFLAEEAPAPDLSGTWTLEAFCAHLAATDLWPGGEPEHPLLRNFRRWAYESAALDLALQQAGRPLHAVLGREPRPVTYVSSFGLGDPADPGKVLRRLERHPGLRLKLDADVRWSAAVVEVLAGTGAVHTVDFKGRYGLEVEDPAALPELYARVLDGLPEALIEDPHDLPEISALLAPHAARVSFDAPIRTVADLDALALPAQTINVKPSRIGSLRELFAVYDACEQRGLALYGGGMGELGVARGQVQLLAALFSPDGPNDVAPPGFHALEPAPGLPPSPLPPAPAPAGFRRAG